MKCPKCGYLGYERVERCRNCGYEFSLVSTAPTPDLRLHDGGSVPQPLDDLDLIDAATPPPPLDRFSDMVPEGRQPAAAPPPPVELPLFGAPITDDVPLITKASPPRPPLSVRRATPEVPRLRSEPRAPLLEWPEPSPVTPKVPRPTPERQVARAVEGASQPEAAAPAVPDPAGLGARAVAAVIDLGLLALVDFIVVYFTMKICRLSMSEVALLPKAPLVAFLLLQNGGYFIAFTATGQTLGKMIAGIRILADDSESAPDVGRATLRALLWMVLVLPAGLGLLTALISRDGRGLHDRFAGTRVVRTGA
jgi:uncharacterized RDD family membrane protein YckC